MEEHMSSENLKGKSLTSGAYHAAQRTPRAPHIQAVVICLVAEEQFWRLKRPARYSDLVLPSRHVILCQTEIYQTKFSRFGVYDDVVGLDVSVHDAPFVAGLYGNQ